MMMAKRSQNDAICLTGSAPLPIGWGRYLITGQPSYHPPIMAASTTQLTHIAIFRQKSPKIAWSGKMVKNGPSKKFAESRYILDRTREAAMNTQFDAELTYGFVVGKIIWIKQALENSALLLCVKNKRGSFYVEADETQIISLDVGTLIMVSGALFSCFRRGQERTRIKAKKIERL
jgi:hypothetical protein